MKKIIVLLIPALILSIVTVITTVDAYPNGLIDGKAMKRTNGTLSHVATDGDEKTSEEFTYTTNTTLKYEFTDPANINGYQLKASSAKSTYTVVLFTLTDINNNKKSIYIGYADMQGSRVKIDEMTNVKTVTIQMYSNEATTIYEFDVFGKINDTNPPDKVTGLTAKAVIEGVDLSWTGSTAADLKGYYIYINNVKQSYMLPAFQTAHTVTGLTVGAIYKFEVTAVDQADNESLRSDSVTAIPLPAPDLTPPAVPIGVTGKELVGGALITWTKNMETDLAGYHVYVNGQRITTTPIKDNSIQLQLIRGNHSVEITAIDRSDNESNKSNLIRVSPLPPPIDTIPPDPVTGLVASMSQDALNIVLKWDASTAVDLKHYQVYGTIKGGQLALITTTSNTTLSIKDFKEDTSYVYMIKTVDISDNISDESNRAEVKTPLKSTNNQVVIGQDYLLLTWTEVVGAVEYSITYNGKKVGTAPAAPPYEYRITKAMGYNPTAPFQKAHATAVFANGSTGGNNSGSNNTNSGFGFTASDIFTNTMFLISSLASFLLLWCVVRFAPQIIGLVKRVVRYVKKELVT